MPKSKSKKIQRKRQVHLFETPEFKAELKRSINENLEKMSQEGFTFPTNIPLEQLLAPCKKTRGKKGRITRPQNAFILYRKDLQERIKIENPCADFKEISRIAGTRWKNETDQIKNNYTLLATLGGLVHQDLFPNYKYQPRQRDNSERKIREEEEEEEEILAAEQVTMSERMNKPWEAMPQIFNKSDCNENICIENYSQEYHQNSPEMKYEENILTSPHIIQMTPRTINLIEPYYEPSITIKHKHEPPDDDLNYFNEFQIDENVITNLNNQVSPSYHTFNNHENSSDSSHSNDEVTDLLMFPTINSYNLQPETSSNTTYIPVTTQVNTTIPAFYTSIIDNIPVYADEINPILAIASASTSPSFAPDPYMDTSQSITNISNVNNSLQNYDMGFLDEWGNQELIERLDLYRS